MVKLVFCLKRLPELSLAQFHDYWLNNHGPLVRSHADTFRIKRYVQTHTLDLAGLNQALAASRAAPDAFDGVAELWWDSLEDLAHIANDPDAIAAGRLLLEDEKRFIDLARSPLFWGVEHTII